MSHLNINFFPELKNGKLTESDLKIYFQFLGEVILKIIYSNGEAEAIYRLFAANIDK
ncbi:MAG: hypothetical protein AAFV71_10660 [Cyanobacteria bacterium J06633_8]